jgi:hypothetical protein
MHCIAGTACAACACLGNIIKEILLKKCNFSKPCRPEATFFLVLYVLYCVAMGFNSQFEAWAVKSLPVPDSWRSAGAEKGKEWRSAFDHMACLF